MPPAVISFCYILHGRCEARNLIQLFQNCIFLSCFQNDIDQADSINHIAFLPRICSIPDLCSILLDSCFINQLRTVICGSILSAILRPFALFFLVVGIFLIFDVFIFGQRTDSELRTTALCLMIWIFATSSISVL